MAVNLENASLVLSLIFKLGHVVRLGALKLLQVWLGESWFDFAAVDHVFGCLECSLGHEGASKCDKAERS